MHYHRWKTIEKSFTPPTTRRWEVEGVSQETMLYMMYGLTVIIQECQKCGEVKPQLAPGNQT